MGVWGESKTRPCMLGNLIAFISGRKHLTRKTVKSFLVDCDKSPDMQTDSFLSLRHYLSLGSWVPEASMWHFVNENVFHKKLLYDIPSTASPAAPSLIQSNSCQSDVNFSFHLEIKWKKVPVFALISAFRKIWFLFPKRNIRLSSDSALPAPAKFHPFCHWMRGWNALTQIVVAFIFKFR